jgi:uncharacterized protein (DUF1330 family)
MIYITQLIFLKQGMEKEFHEFEAIAIPLMQKYTGKLIQRVRPDSNSFIDGENDRPYEVHIISFNSNKDFELFLKDKQRQDIVHLKEASIRSTFLIKGEKI